MPTTCGSITGGTVTTVSATPRRCASSAAAWRASCAVRLSVQPTLTWLRAPGTINEPGATVTTGQFACTATRSSSGPRIPWAARVRVRSIPRAMTCAVSVRRSNSVLTEVPMAETVCTSISGSMSAAALALVCKRTSPDGRDSCAPKLSATVNSTWPISSCPCRRRASTAPHRTAWRAARDPSTPTKTRCRSTFIEHPIPRLSHDFPLQTTTGTGIRNGDPLGD